MSAHRKKKPKPVLTSEILDEKANIKIAQLLELINTHHKVTDEHLKNIENAIKKTLSETNTNKEKYYLRHSSLPVLNSGDNTKSKTRRVVFSSSPKKSGGKTKKYKKSRRNKRF